MEMRRSLIFGICLFYQGRIPARKQKTKPVDISKPLQVIAVNDQSLPALLSGKLEKARR